MAVLQSYTDYSTYVTVNSSTTRYAQTFEHTSSFLLESIDLYMARNGSPSVSIVCAIYAVDGSNHPTGASLEASSRTKTQIGFGTGFKNFPFAGTLELSGSTTYAFVTYCTGISFGGDYRQYYDGTSPTYAEGNYLNSTNSGSTWTPDTNRDFTFKINGTETGGVSVEPSPVTMVFTAAASHTVFIPPIDQVTTRRMVAAADNTIWYEDI